MHLETLVVGRLAANCYLLGCEETKEAIVVDPGGEAEVINDRIAAGGWKVKYIVNTHAHMDHTAANGAVKQFTGAPLLIHAADAPTLAHLGKRSFLYAGADPTPVPADRVLQDGEEIAWGKLSARVIHTPGHTPGGICLYVGSLLFAGDTLFAGSVGRSDFPGGSHKDLIDSIKQKLLILPDETEVYPGHGPSTTIGWERQENPFL